MKSNKQTTLDELRIIKKNSRNSSESEKKVKEVKGPYELPEGWRWVRLGEITEINKRSVNPTIDFPDKKFIYIDISGIENGSGKIKEVKILLGKDAPSRARRLIHTNDILMSTVRPYLKAFAIVPPEYDQQVCSTGFAVLTPKKGVLSKYLLFCLFSDILVRQYNQMMLGAHYPALTNEQVKSLKIPIPFKNNKPDLKEQKRIVAKIEELFSKIDRIKELRKQAKEQAENLLKAALHHVFSKADEKGWRWVRLGEIIDLSNGKGITKKEMTKNRAYPVYGSNGIIGRTDKYLIDRDTIIIGRVGACGSINFAKAPAWISDNAMYVSKFLCEIDKKFLYYALVHLDISQLAKISAQPSISQESVKKQKIPLPPLEEQKRISAYLDSIAEKQRKLLELYEKTEKELEVMKQAILNKAFRGQF